MQGHISLLAAFSDPIFEFQRAWSSAVRRNNGTDNEVDTEGNDGNEEQQATLIFVCFVNFCEDDAACECCGGIPMEKVPWSDRTDA